MTVDDALPMVTSMLAVSSLSSSSISSSTSSLISGRLTRAQVATDNSSSFIQFRTNSRQSSFYVPIDRPRTSLSTTPTPPCLLTADSQSLSDKSKSSNTPTSSVTSDERKRSQSQHGSNPILDNPLLNHRREKPKPCSRNISTSATHTTRLHPTGKPLKALRKMNPISIIHINTPPLLAHQTNSIPNRSSISTENKSNNPQEVPYFDKTKYDYIARWLTEVRLATYSSGTASKTKAPRKPFVTF